MKCFSQQGSYDTALREQYLDSIYYASEELIYSNPDSAKVLISELGDSIQKLNDPYWDGYYYDLLATLQYYQNDLTEARENALKAVSLFKAEVDSFGLSVAYLNLGNIHADIGNYDLAIDYYQKSVDIEAAWGEGSSEAYTTLNIAAILIEQNKYELAEEYIRESIKLCIKVEDRALLASAYDHLAEVLIHFNNIENALYYSNTALDIAVEENDKLEMAHANSNMGLIFEKLGNNDSAVFFLENAIAHAEGYGDPYSTALYQIRLSNVYYRTNNLSSAQTLAQKAWETSLEEKSKFLLRESSMALAKAFEALGKYKDALQFQKITSAYSDTINGFSVEKRMLERERLLMDEENKLLEQQTASKDRVIEQTSWFVIIAIILLVVSIAFIITLIFNSRKNKNYNQALLYNNSVIQNKQNEISRQSKELLKKNIELESLNKTKDRLFSILSHDLMEPFNQIKGVLKVLDFKDIEESDKELLLKKLNESVDRTSNAVENLLLWSKNQISGIKTLAMVFDINELVDKVFAQLQSSMDRKGLKFERTIAEGLSPIADMDQMEIVLRNLLNNAIKFSKEGDEILLKAYQQHEMMVIEVTDHGVGMTNSQIEKLIDSSQAFSTPGTMNEKGTGLGLTIINEFLSANKGHLEIFSEPGKGSTFKISIPQA